MRGQRRAGVVLFRPDSAGRRAVLAFVRERTSRIASVDSRWPSPHPFSVSDGGLRRQDARFSCPIHDIDRRGSRFNGLRFYRLLGRLTWSAGLVAEQAGIEPNRMSNDRESGRSYS